MVHSATSLFSMDFATPIISTEALKICTALIISKVIPPWPIQCNEKHRKHIKKFINPKKLVTIKTTKSQSLNNRTFRVQTYLVWGWRHRETGRWAASSALCCPADRPASSLGRSLHAAVICHKSYVSASTITRQTYSDRQTHSDRQTDTLRQTDILRQTNRHTQTDRHTQLIIILRCMYTVRQNYRSPWL